MTDVVPEITGSADLAYLTRALARAGLPAPSGPLAEEPLTGGRTGAQVLRLTAGNGSYVLKQLPRDSWRLDGTGRADGGEARLWLHGAVQQLGDRMRWPVIDVAWERDRDLYWMLMQDVGGGIRGRGAFSRDDSRTLFAAFADMQARFYDNDQLDGAPLPEVAGTVRVFTEPLLHLTGRRTSDEPWVTAMLDGFQVMGAFVPLFLEILGPVLADDYLALCADETWRQLFAHHPSSLLQGDPRRANISFDGEKVALFDWEFAAVGPPACDLQWHCFLHYWAYPPDGVQPGDDCDDLRDFYATALEQRLGRAIDRKAFAASWRLGWLKVMTQLGYVLIDPLYPDGGSAEQRMAVANLAARAVERAIDARSALA